MYRKGRGPRTDAGFGQNITRPVCVVSPLDCTLNNHTFRLPVTGRVSEKCRRQYTQGDAAAAVLPCQYIIRRWWRVCVDGGMVVDGV